MIKKIKTDQLVPGMFIENLNCGWLNHPFVKNSMEVSNGEMIDKILRHGIPEVYIDTDRGLDVMEISAEREDAVSSEAEISGLMGVEDAVKVHEKVPLREELVNAQEIRTEAKRTIRNLMEEVRLGRPIEVEEAEHVVERMAESIFRNRNALISLGRIREQDEYTFVHSMAVCILLISFGQYLDMDYHSIKQLGLGGLLHDIGKVNVPREILTKTNGLSDEEFERIRGHVDYGKNILAKTPNITEASICVAEQHHERIDGSGYPRNLRGSGISIFGQMAAIIDVYDAMTSKRCYQRQFQPTETLKKLFEWSGSRFDKKLVQHFICCVGIYPVGTLVRLESGLLGVIINNERERLLEPDVRIVSDTRHQRFIQPYDIDLSDPSSNRGKDKILNYEPPEKWHIKTDIYLMEEGSSVI